MDHSVQELLWEWIWVLWDWIWVLWACIWVLWAGNFRPVGRTIAAF